MAIIAGNRTLVYSRVKKEIMILDSLTLRELIELSLNDYIHDPTTFENIWTLPDNRRTND